MKKIGVVTPIYNEEENLPVYYKTMTEIMNSMDGYDYEILLIDNCSTDSSREFIRELCNKDHHVKAIFNLTNFGYNNSVYHGLKNSEGDCTVLINCDFQDPPELIPQFVKEWEAGYKCVLGIKKSSKEAWRMRIKRKFYYWVVDRMSDKKQILNHTGFGLYDKKFIEILKQINDPAPYIKELVSTFSFKTKKIEYEQRARERGSGITDVYILYDDAMTGLTKTSKRLMRCSMLIGFVIGTVSFIFGIHQIVLKILHPEQYISGMAFVAVGVFILSALQLFFTGILGEYILTINIKTSGRDAVFEEERINFNE